MTFDHFVFSMNGEFMSELLSFWDFLIPSSNTRYSEVSVILHQWNPGSISHLSPCSDIEGFHFPVSAFILSHPLSIDTKFWQWISQLLLWKCLWRLSVLNLKVEPCCLYFSKWWRVWTTDGNGAWRDQTWVLESLFKTWNRRNSTCVCMGRGGQIPKKKILYGLSSKPDVRESGVQGERDVKG